MFPIAVVVVAAVVAAIITATTAAAVLLTLPHCASGSFTTKNILRPATGSALRAAGFAEQDSACAKGAVLSHRHSTPAQGEAPLDAGRVANQRITSGTDITYEPSR